MVLGRRALVAALALAFLIAGAAVGLAPPAFAAAPCVFDPVTGSVSITLTPSPAAVTVARTEQGAITVDGVRCGGANVQNVDTINVAGTASAVEVLDVDLRNGPLAPGRTSEPGSDEIELYVYWGGDNFPPDQLNVVLGGDDDRIAASAAALDLDSADAVPDDDIVLVGTRSAYLHVYGQGGDDTIDLGRLTLSSLGYGGAGDDSLVGGSGTVGNLYGDHSFGEDPFDQYVPPAAAGADRLVGGNPRINPRLRGGPGDDVTVAGARGADFWAERTIDGTDVMQGGPGRDTVRYDYRETPVEVSLDGVANDGDPTGSGEHDLVGSSVEDVQGGGGDDLILGDSAANVLYGNGGADHLIGGGGDDFLLGFWGNDRLEGGDGNDWISDPTDDNWLDGGKGDDTLRAGNGADQLDGGAGHDSIDGGSGDDRLVGGDGIDRLFAGEGADYIAALDLQSDVVDGGFDDQLDFCKCDPIDSISNVP